VPFLTGVAALAVATGTVASILLGRTAWTYADGTAPGWFLQGTRALFFASALLAIGAVTLGIRDRRANGGRPFRESYAIALGGITLLELAAFVVVATQTEVLE
jgi:hypothetical protein